MPRPLDSKLLLGIWSAQASRPFLRRVMLGGAPVLPRTTWFFFWCFSNVSIRNVANSSTAAALSSWHNKIITLSRPLFLRYFLKNRAVVCVRYDRRLWLPPVDKFGFLIQHVGRLDRTIGSLINWRGLQLVSHRSPVSLLNVSSAILARDLSTILPGHYGGEVDDTSILLASAKGIIDNPHELLVVNYGCLYKITSCWGRLSEMLRLITWFHLVGSRSWSLLGVYHRIYSPLLVASSCMRSYSLYWGNTLIVRLQKAQTETMVMTCSLDRAVILMHF